MPNKQKRCINVRLNTDLSYCRITGIEVLEDGRILLCDNQNDKIKLFQWDGTFLSDYCVEGLPFDLRMLRNFTFVVTNDIGSKLIVLNIIGDTILHERDIPINPGAMGVCALDGHLLLTYPWSNPPEILKIDDNGKVVQTINRNSMQKPIFAERPVSICAFSNQIYVSCMSIDGKKDKVYQLSSDGSILSVLEHPELQEAKYISKDMFGNLYVCSMLKSCIVCFDRSGHKSRVVMSLKDGLRDPCAIGILDQTLFVAQEGLDTVQVLTLPSFGESAVVPLAVKNL